MFAWGYGYSLFGSVEIYCLVSQALLNRALKIQYLVATMREKVSSFTGMTAPCILT